MRIEQLHPTQYQITLHSYELAALLSAARWVAEGAEGELSDEAKQHLIQVLDNYDKAAKNINQVTETDAL